MDERFWRQGVAGGILIVIGAVLLGSQAGWYDIGGVAGLWPVVLMVVGVRRGVGTREGFLWTGWGTVLLMWTTGVWALAHSWPLLIVLHGLAIMMWPAGCTGARRDGSRVG